MTASKRKGTRGENAVVDYLRTQGYPHAERRALAGINDRGDVTGVPAVVIEVKNCKTMELAAWVDEAEREKVNDGAQVGVVWHHRRGKVSPADWFVTMTGRQFVALMRDAGYGGPATAPAASWLAARPGDPAPAITLAPDAKVARLVDEIAPARVLAGLAAMGWPDDRETSAHPGVTPTRDYWETMHGLLVATDAAAVAPENLEVASSTADGMAEIYETNR